MFTTSTPPIQAIDYFFDIRIEFVISKHLKRFLEPQLLLLQLYQILLRGLVGENHY